MNGGVQLSLVVGLDPHELAKLPILARAVLYGELNLDRAQRQAAEEATRAVIAKRYGRGQRHAA